MTDDQIAAIAEAVKLREAHEIGRTHWDGCEVDRSHRDCAIRLLLAALAAATQEIEAGHAFYKLTVAQRDAAWQENERLKAERENHKTIWQLVVAGVAEATGVNYDSPSDVTDCVRALLSDAEGFRAKCSAAERQRDALREALKSLLDSHKMNTQCSHNEEPDYCVQCEFEQQIRVASAADAARAALAATEGQ